MSAIRSFRARFEAMVSALIDDPRVEVYEVEIRPPANDVALREAEAEIGMPLPKDLLEFYRRHDGVFLEWGLRGHEYEYRTDPFQYPDYGQPPGCINLVPVSQAMSTG